MADKVNIFVNLGPNAEYHTDGKDTEEDECVLEEDGDLDGLVDMLCDLMCGDEDDDCYSEEEIDDLVSKLAEEFGFSKKKAKAIVDFVFEWAE